MIKKLILPVLLVLSMVTTGQVDSGRYDATRAILLLRGGGQFKISEWGGHINGFTQGQYQINGDTLILNDVLDEKRQSVRWTTYLLRFGSLTFIKDSVTNFDYEAKAFRKENGIPEDSKITPPSLKKYGHFIQTNILWDFNFYTSESIDGRLMKIDKISFESNVPSKIATEITSKIKKLDQHGVHNSKYGFADLLREFYKVDGFKLQTIMSANAINEGYINIDITYEPDSR